MEDMAVLSAVHTRPVKRTAESSRRIQMRIVTFRIASLLLETLVVYLVGLSASFIWRLQEITFFMPHPKSIAIAYALIVAVTNSTPSSSPKLQNTSAFSSLFAILSISMLVMIYFEHAPVMLGYWFLATSLAVALCRMVEHAVVLRFGGVLCMRKPAAFIGNSHIAGEMLRHIRASSQQDIEPIGFFDDRTGRRGPLDGMLPRLGTIDDLITFIHENELHEVYVALPWAANERITYLINQLRFLPLTVRLLPDTLPPAPSKGAPHQLGGVVMSTLMLPPITLSGRIMKRCADIIISSTLLLLLLPIFITTAILIKLDSRGPVFFMQPRSGQYGRTFNIFKFRSMYATRLDAAAETLVSSGDVRVTRVGRIIRKYSVDEIPQILNVFLGDMSLVGPRPHAQRAKAAGRVYAEVLDDYMLRYRVKPGITGWAQVNGWRGNTDTEEKLRKRVEFDFYYITHWSLWLDLKILLKTFHSVVSPPKDNV